MASELPIKLHDSQLSFEQLNARYIALRKRKAEVKDRHLKLLEENNPIHQNLDLWQEAEKQVDTEITQIQKDSENLLVDLVQSGFKVSSFTSDPDEMLVGWNV